jgi:ribosomal protein L16 Arg81 hydroxylase
VLPEIRFEKKRVESCEESIESRISFIKEKLTKQMAEIEIDWLDCFKKDLKDLSPKLAEQLSQDFARTMSRQPSISKMQMEEPPCP